MKILCVSTALLYLTYCYLIFRTASFDGFATYLKPIYLSSLGNNYFIGLANPIRPFFIELILGLIWRYTSLRVIGLLLGIVTICALFFINNLYKNLLISSKNSKLGILILLSSPVFLYLGLIEYKIEMFLLLFCVLSYIFFIRFLQKFRSTDLLLYILFIGLALLTKFYVFSIAVILSAFLVFEIVVHKEFTLLKKILYTLLISGILLPMIIWVKLFGAQFSYLGFINRNFKVYTVPHTEISVDENTYLYCKHALKVQDQAQFLPNDSIKDLVTQPINYFLGNTTKIKILSLFDPGILIYVSILFLIPFVISSFRKFSKLEKYLWSMCLIYVSIYYLSVGATFWYLLPVFPFIALVIPLMFDSNWLLVKKNPQNIILAVVLTYITLILYVCYNNVNLYKSTNYSTLNFGGFDVMKYSSFIDSLEKDKYIYSLSEFDLATFAKTQNRILPHTFFFSNKKVNSLNLKDELVRKNVKYIIIDPTQYHLESYPECYQEELKNFYEFAKVYARPVFWYETSPIVWELF